MLWKGIAYLSEVQPPLDIWEQTRNYPGITGVMHVEGDGVKALEAAMTAGEDDITGAMRQAVMNHLAYIHRHGVDGWLSEVRAQRPGRLYEWEGDLMPAAEDGAP